MKTEYKQQLLEYVQDVIKPLQNDDVPFSLHLDAHTDDWGSEEYNLALSRRRGSAVSAVLRTAGVPLDAIRINAYGQSRPVNDNETEEARSLNRRVEVRLERE